MQKCFTWLNSMDYQSAPLFHIPLTPGPSEPPTHHVSTHPKLFLPPVFRLVTYPGSRRLQFIGNSDSVRTSARECTYYSINSKATICLPEYVESRVDSALLSALICARWSEHLLEWHILELGLQPDWMKKQEKLVKLRLERAELEVRLYAQAIANGVELE